MDNINKNKNKNNIKNAQSSRDKKRKRIEKNLKKRKSAKNNKIKKAIQKKKEISLRLQKRKELYKKLNKNKLTKDEQELIKSSSMKNIKLTKRQYLKNLLKKHKMGLQLTDYEKSRLFAPEDENNNNNDDLQYFNIDEENLYENKNKNNINFNNNISNNNDNNNNDNDDNDDDNDSDDEHISKKIKLNNDLINNNNNNNNNTNSALNILKRFNNLSNNNQIINLNNKNNIEEEENNINENDEMNIDKLNMINSNKDEYIPKPIELILPETLYDEKNIINDELKIWQNINRKKEIIEQRLELPISGMEQEITEAVLENDIIIICGETGSGKSTQVPQFLYEIGLTYKNHGGMIGITQPRRVAAISTAERVADEMNTKCVRGGFVGYQIRYDSSGITPFTHIKFMTDGILLQEIRQDFLLRKYNVIILDEAHERNLNTDILIGMLSRIIPLRKEISKEENIIWDKLNKKERKKKLKKMRKSMQKYEQLKKDIENEFKNMDNNQDIEEDINNNENQYNSDDEENENQFIDILNNDENNNNNNNNNENNNNLFKKDNWRPSYILPLQPLRVIIMSATLRVSDFTENKNLFSIPPPIISVDSRQHPVTIHFNRKTELNDYFNVALNKVEKIHKKLPQGGILVFLTGKREILSFCKKLKEKLNKNKNKRIKKMNNEMNIEKKENKLDLKEKINENDDDDYEIDDENEEEEETRNINDTNEYNNYKENNEENKNNKIDNNNNNNKEEEKKEEERENPNIKPEFVHVLPLFAMLPKWQQKKVFQKAPKNHRLIIVSTNVAETSLTIPGIKYVVDTGREKVKTYDKKTTISKYEVKWISKASANQRAGRAGRMGPGHCYRLYSSAYYDRTLKLFSEPETSTRSLEDIILQMKGMGIKDIEHFPFPTLPDLNTFHRAFKLLKNIGAIDLNTDKISNLGKSIIKYPLSVRFSKMITLAQESSILPYIICIVSMMTESEPFLINMNDLNNDDDINEDNNNNNNNSDNDNEKNNPIVLEEQKLLKKRLKIEKSKKLKLLFNKKSDCLTRLNIILGYISVLNLGYYKSIENEMYYYDNIETFCKEWSLNIISLSRSYKMIKQLIYIINQNQKENNNNNNILDINLFNNINLPNENEENLILQAISSGLLDCIARRVEIGKINHGTKLQRECAYISCNPLIKEPLYIHPNSSCFSPNSEAIPEFLTYQTITRSPNTNRAFMNCVSDLNTSWLPYITYGSPLISYSGPILTNSPYYDEHKDIIMCYINVKYGHYNWSLPSYPIEMNLSYDKINSKPNSKCDLSKNEIENEEYRWFTRLLLEGKIIRSFLKFKNNSYLNDPPSLITTKRPLKKVLFLKSIFQDNQIRSKKLLINKWKIDSNFAKNEIKLWIKKDYYREFNQIWTHKI